MNTLHGQQRTFKNFAPLISIITIICLITLAHQLYYGWNLVDGMRIMMASFFLIFGSFKIVDLAGFAHGYSTYDLIAKRFTWYGYIYPFIELGLGLAYLFNWNPFATNLFTLILMLTSAAGVFNELYNGRNMMCSCLGTLFKIPMTYVTLVEDLIMAAMALAMLFIM